MIFLNSAFLLVVSVVVIICAPLSDARKSGYVVGGVNGEEGELPYQISLQYYGQHICGGSIINNCWVLTAAHCVQGMSQSALIVLAGTNNLNKGGVRSAISKIIPHENFRDKIVNDIALIKLKDCVTYSKNIQPVNLVSSDIGEDYNILIVSGWGSTDQSGKIPTNHLKKLQVIPITNQHCNSFNFFIKIMAGNICTLNIRGQGACKGDSGGPLVDVKSQTLIGLVSAGTTRGCAIGYPNIYTRISTYVPWIRNKVGY